MAVAFRQKCLDLRCQHTHYDRQCPKCIERKPLAIFCDEGLLARLHYAPSEEAWNPSPPPLETPAKPIAATAIRHNGLKETLRYTTPLSQLPKRKMNSWPYPDQLKALAQTFIQIGEPQNISPPQYIPMEYIDQARRSLQRLIAKCSKPADQKQPPEDPPQPVTPLGTDTQKGNKNQETPAGIPPEILQNFPRTPPPVAMVAPVVICQCFSPDCPARKESQCPGLQLAVNATIPGEQLQVLETRTLQNTYNCEAPVTLHQNLPYCQFRADALVGPALLDTGSALDLMAYEAALKAHENNAEVVWDKEKSLEAISCNKSKLEIVGQMLIPNFQLHETNPPIHLRCWVLKDSFAPIIIGYKTQTDLQGILVSTQKKFYYTIRQENINNYPKNEQETQDDTPPHPCPGTPAPITDHLDHPIGMIAIPIAKNTIAPLNTLTISLPANRYPALLAAINHSPEKEKTFTVNKLPAIVNRQLGRGGTTETLQLTILNNTEKEHNLDLVVPITNPARIANITEDIENRLQGRLDPKERIGLPSLQPPQEKISFPTIQMFGSSPFNEDSSNFLIFLVYLIILYGHSTRLMEKSAEQLQLLAEEYADTRAISLLQTIHRARKQHNIRKLYYNIPLMICGHLHRELTVTYQHTNEITVSAASQIQKTRQANAVMDRLFRNVQALAILYFLNAKVLQEQCDIYGRSAYFHFSSKELPFPIMTPTEEIYPTSSICEPAIIKNEQELQNLLQPEAEPYSRPIKEFEERVFETYEDLQQQACQQVDNGRYQAKNQALQLDDINTAEDLAQLLDFSRSPAALHQFCADQTGNNITRTIPLTEFHQSLVEAKWVAYESTAEVEQDYIPAPMQEEYRKFLRLLSDPTFINTSNTYRLPDLPPSDMFRDPTLAPSPLYITEGPLTGMVDTAYLAFCCAPLLQENHVILRPEHEIQFWLFGALLFTFGQFLQP